MAEPLLLANARLPTGRIVDVLVDRGRVAAVSPAGARQAQPATRLDTDGRYLLPGLWDEHVHFTQWALTRQRLDVAAAETAAGAADLVRQRIAADPSALVAPPLVGYGFRDALWPDAPSADLLDSASQGGAVVLVSADLHCLWLSTAASEQLGIPIDGTGLLREDAAFEANKRLAEVPESLLDSWVGQAADAAAARGVVGIVDLEMDWNPGSWTRRVRRGIRALRVETGIYTEHLDRAIDAGLRTGTPLPGCDGLVSTGPFKILIDGSLNTRTAYCFTPYAGGSDGMLTVQPDHLRELMHRASAAGLVPAVHAIGDRANRIALDAFGRLGIGGRIEHAQLVTDDDVPRFAQLGVRASVQPDHAMADRDAADRHWHGRTAGAFRLRSFLDAGAQLAFGSDAPVSPLDPWRSIAAAVFRTDNSLPPWHPEQGISIAEALASSARGKSGVAVGQIADLVLVEEDPLSAPADILRRMPVGMTVRGGEITYSAFGGSGLRSSSDTSQASSPASLLSAGSRADM